MATPSSEDGGDQRLLTDVGLVSWSSFLAACMASILFFAAVDPQLLRDAGPRIFDNLSREAGYALGFFFFWVLGAAAAALSVYMVRSAEWHDDHRDTERDSD
jgi:hypothetical protein